MKLRKDSSGLGFSVQGGLGWNPDPLQCIVRIKKVFPLGSAAKSGQLQEGDVLLEVNRHNVRDMTHNVRYLFAFTLKTMKC